jgi:hypothetical protein
MESYWLGAAFAVTGMIGIVWRWRARAVKRWLAALDVYADRQIALERRAEALPIPGRIGHRKNLDQTVDSGFRRTTIQWDESAEILFPVANRRKP